MPFNWEQANMDPLEPFQQASPNIGLGVRPPIQPDIATQLPPPPPPPLEIPASQLPVYQQGTLANQPVDTNAPIQNQMLAAMGQQPTQLPIPANAQAMTMAPRTMPASFNRVSGPSVTEGTYNPYALANLPATERGLRTDVEVGATRGKELALKGGEQAAQSAEKQAQLAEREAFQRQSDAQKEEDYNKHFQSEVARRQYQLDEDAQNIANQRIDPFRVINNQSTASKITGLFAAVLGGFMSGFRGGANPYFEQLDKMIDQDIRGQELNLNKLRTAADIRKNSLAQFMANGASMAEARDRTRNMIYAGLKQQAQAQMATAQSDKERLAAEQAVAQIDDKMTQYRLGLVEDAKRNAAAQASAAASARNKDFERYLKLRGLEQKDRELDIQAGKDQKDNMQSRVQGLANELEKAKIPQAQEKIKSLHERNPGLFTGEPLAGVGGVINEAKGKLVEGSPNVLKPLAGKVFTEQERANRQSVKQAFDAYRQMVTGAGASVEELQRLEDSAMGSKTPAEIAGFLAQAENYTNAAIKNLAAGYGPDAYQELLRRKGELPQNPSAPPVMPSFHQVGKK